jgi:hypothetical protein
MNGSTITRIRRGGVAAAVALSMGSLGRGAGTVLLD